MALRVPIFEVHDIATTEWPRPVSIRRFLARCAPESLLPLFLALKLVRVAVGVSRLMPHQFHEPLRRLALDLEHHGSLQCAQPIMDEKKRNEDYRDTDRYEPLVADVTWRMEHKPLCRELVVELLNERLKGRVLQAQPERRDPALKKFLVAQ